MHPRVTTIGIVGSGWFEGCEELDCWSAKKRRNILTLMLAHQASYPHQISIVDSRCSGLPGHIVSGKKARHWAGITVLDRVSNAFCNSCPRHPEEPSTSQRRNSWIGTLVHCARRVHRSFSCMPYFRCTSSSGKRSRNTLRVVPAGSGVKRCLSSSTQQAKTRKAG